VRAKLSSRAQTSHSTGECGTAADTGAEAARHDTNDSTDKTSTWRGIWPPEAMDESLTVVEIPRTSTTLIMDG
jgi:hypothetical protein